MKIASTGPSTGKHIIDVIAIYYETDYSFLYVLLEAGIIEIKETGKNIQDYIFSVKPSFAKDVERIKTYLERKQYQDFVVVASYPEKMDVKNTDIERLYPRICRLIMSAKKNLLFVNPYFDKKGIAKILPYITEAYRRGVKIKLISRKDRISKQFSENLSSKMKGSMETIYFGGSEYFLHAKCIIADDNEAYIGSANITGTSLGSNLELGVLFNGRKVKSLLKFIDGALDI